MDGVGRRNWLAGALGIALPGLGQLFNGELLKGACLFVIFILAFLTGLGLTIYLPDNHLAAGVLVTLAVTLAIYLYAVADAFKSSSGVGKDIRLKSRWYAFTALWMIGYILFVGAAYNYAKDNILQVYKIATDSMMPELIKGDRVIVDKTAYRRMPPKGGDIIVFIYPDDRSKVFIKRVAGLPGSVISADGREYAVPHGTVYVYGDNLRQSKDSRDFGPVPLSDVIGKARQVIYSTGAEGMRWDRIGRPLTGAAP